MRLERMTAVVVLAAGLLSGAAVRAAAPDEAPDAAPTKLAPVPSAPNAPLRPIVPKPKPKEPGAQHKLLSAFVGKWKSKPQNLQDVSAATAKESDGTAEGKLVMGGRFVEVSHKGLVNDLPFEGLQLIGFDTVTNRYTGIWIDNASTAIIHFVGTYDAGKKQLTMTAHYSDQASQRLTLARIVLTAVDENSWTYDEYISHAKGEKETHTMSITFKRA